MYRYDLQPKDRSPEPPAFFASIFFSKGHEFEMLSAATWICSLNDLFLILCHGQQAEEAEEEDVQEEKKILYNWPLYEKFSPRAHVWQSQRVIRSLFILRRWSLWTFKCTARRSRFFLAPPHFKSSWRAFFGGGGRRQSCQKRRQWTSCWSYLHQREGMRKKTYSTPNAKRRETSSMSDVLIYRAMPSI